jgi:GrpB-like predicted nucleotidyltransferase (UPF0157 family)
MDFKVFGMNITDGLSLLIESPRDFLYSFTYPDDDHVNIQPFNPGSVVVAKFIIRQIKKIDCKLKVYFIGSSALRIKGNNDIDIYVACNTGDFDQNYSKLKKVFGKPANIKNNFVEWSFKKNIFHVDLVLINQDTPRFKEQIYIFQTLKKNRRILKEYIELKESLNGKSTRDYIQGRMKFFNRLLRS